MARIRCIRPEYHIIRRIHLIWPRAISLYFKNWNGSSKDVFSMKTHLNHFWIAVTSVLTLKENILNTKIEKYSDILFQWCFPRPISKLICCIVYIYFILWSNKVKIISVKSKPFIGYKHICDLEWEKGPLYFEKSNLGFER